MKWFLSLGDLNKRKMHFVLNQVYKLLSGVVHVVHLQDERVRESKNFNFLLMFLPQILKNFLVTLVFTIENVNGGE